MARTLSPDARLVNYTRSDSSYCQPNAVMHNKNQEFAKIRRQKCGILTTRSSVPRELHSAHNRLINDATVRPVPAHRRRQPSPRIEH